MLGGFYGEPGSASLLVLSPILSYVSVTPFSPFLNEEFSLDSGVALSRDVGQWVHEQPGQHLFFMCHHCCLEKTGPVFCLLTGVPLGSLPSCPGLVSAQLLEERPSNSPPVPAQLNVHLPASMSSPLPGV